MDAPLGLAAVRTMKVPAPHNPPAQAHYFNTYIHVDTFPLPKPSQAMQQVSAQQEGCA